MLRETLDQGNLIYNPSTKFLWSLLTTNVVVFKQSTNSRPIPYSTQVCSKSNCSYGENSKWYWFAHLGSIILSIISDIAQQDQDIASSLSDLAEVCSSPEIKLTAQRKKCEAQQNSKTTSAIEELLDEIIDQQIQLYDATKVITIV
jgi:hypothetical protein